MSIRGIFWCSVGLFVTGIVLMGSVPPEGWSGMEAGRFFAGFVLVIMAVATLIGLSRHLPEEDA